MNPDSTPRWPDLAVVAARLTDHGLPAQLHPGGDPRRTFLFVNNPHTGQQLRVGPGTAEAHGSAVWCDDDSVVIYDRRNGDSAHGPSDSQWRLLAHPNPEKHLVESVLLLFGHIPPAPIDLEEVADLVRAAGVPARVLACGGTVWSLAAGVQVDTGDGYGATPVWFGPGFRHSSTGRAVVTIGSEAAVSTEQSGDDLAWAPDVLSIAASAAAAILDTLARADPGGFRRDKITAWLTGNLTVNASRNLQSTWPLFPDRWDRWSTSTDSFLYDVAALIHCLLADQPTGLPDGVISVEQTSDSTPDALTYVIVMDNGVRLLTTPVTCDDLLAAVAGATGAQAAAAALAAVVRAVHAQVGRYHVATGHHSSRSEPQPPAIATVRQAYLDAFATPREALLDFAGHCRIAIAYIDRQFIEDVYGDLSETEWDTLSWHLGEFDERTTATGLAYEFIEDGLHDAGLHRVRRP